MDAVYLQKLEEVFKQKVIETKPLSGGCISEAKFVQLASLQVFVKTNQNNPELLACEITGLEEIRKSNSIPVPKILFYEPGMLVLEYISTKSPSKKDFKQLGQKLALLHKNYSSCFGFVENNFIGASPQINTPVKAFNDYKDWFDFYWNKRLLFQWSLCEKNKLATPTLEDALFSAEEKIKYHLSQSEEGPCLLHGDLWNGNFLVSNKSEVYLIDPAVYYGHREAEIAMTKMFGGFSPEFYQAYHKEYPLRSDWEQRLPIYILYHALNHLNLFGQSYYRQCLSLLNDIR